MQPEKHAGNASAWSNDCSSKPFLLEYPLSSDRERAIQARDMVEKRTFNETESGLSELLGSSPEKEYITGHIPEMMISLRLTSFERTTRNPNACPEALSILKLTIWISFISRKLEVFDRFLCIT
jgi:hypothetical protein